MQTVFTLDGLGGAVPAQAVGHPAVAQALGLMRWAAQQGLGQASEEIVSRLRTDLLLVKVLAGAGVGLSLLALIAVLATSGSRAAAQRRQGR